MIQEIRLLTDIEEVQKLYEFIKQFPLDYPFYFKWLEKCKRQLELKEKKAFYAINENQIVGNLIFQNLKGDPFVIEIKNFRIAEKHRNLGVGSALESMLYSFAISNDFKKIQIDTHQNNLEMIQFLIKREYVIESMEVLYRKNKQEIILSKTL